jgi:hypothetical protein
MENNKIKIVEVNDKNLKLLMEWFCFDKFRQLKLNQEPFEVIFYFNNEYDILIKLEKYTGFQGFAIEK